MTWVQSLRTQGRKRALMLRICDEDVPITCCDLCTQLVLARQDSSADCTPPCSASFSWIHELSFFDHQKMIYLMFRLLFLPWVSWLYETTVSELDACPVEILLNCCPSHWQPEGSWFLTSRLMEFLLFLVYNLWVCKVVENPDFTATGLWTSYHPPHTPWKLPTWFFLCGQKTFIHTISPCFAPIQ